MEDSKTRTLVQKYLRRSPIFDRLIKEKIHDDCELIIVIPAYLEENLSTTLSSLFQNKIDFHCEVIIIINHSQNELESNKELNGKCFKDYQDFKASNNHPFIHTHCILLELPTKHAGVGLARKIGMDEAVRRFLDIERLNAPIVNLDADCTVNQKYISGIRNYYVQNVHSPGANIHFEHPEDKDGIILYELFLRYYKNALAFCGLPYAFHTIGSSMSVMTDAYVKEGGMNRRKAGEDFYFIHKIIPRGHYGLVRDSIVYPSSRISQRVPFGTGKAMEKYAENNDELNFTYSIQSFDDLKEVVKNSRSWYQVISKGHNLSELYNALPESFKSFADLEEFKYYLEESRDNSNSEETFLKRIFQWLDAFKVLKYVHHCRDQYYSNQDIISMSKKLLSRSDISFEESANASELLRIYRQLDQLA